MKRHDTGLYAETNYENYYAGSKYVVYHRRGSALIEGSPSAAAPISTIPSAIRSPPMIL